MREKMVQYKYRWMLIMIEKIKNTVKIKWKS